MNSDARQAMIKTTQLVKKVSTQNGELIILDDINLAVEKGETVAIIGASGSGKSTLLGLLAGLDLPSSGDIGIDQRSLAAMNEDQRAELRADTIGFVFQNFQLMPNLTALENVLLPVELQAKQSNAREWAQQLLERVGLGERLHHYPKQLSGGEQQRVAIARAFATSPALLLADEPTGNLDSNTGEHIIELLFSLNREQNTTLVLVTHDLELAARCDRQIQLQAGKIVNG